MLLLSRPVLPTIQLLSIADRLRVAHGRWASWVGDGVGLCCAWAANGRQCSTAVWPGVSEVKVMGSLGVVSCSC